MQRTHDRVQSLAPTLALSRELNSLASDPQTSAEAFANLKCNYPARRTLSRPHTSAARRRAATLAPAARCHFDLWPPFEPMTEPGGTGHDTDTRGGGEGEILAPDLDDNRYEGSDSGSTESSDDVDDIMDYQN